MDKEEKKTISYTRNVYDECLRKELTEARYKGVVMQISEHGDMIFIDGMESTNKGHGECQEMIDLLREDFKGKELCGSPPVSDASKHIFDKKGVEYKRFMRQQ